MHKICTIIAAAGFSLFAGTARAQFQGQVFQENLNGIKVFANNQEKTLAWSGGDNIPQFAMADLNHDGLKDLVIYEMTPYNRVKTFINNGSAGNPDYRYNPKYEANFPSIMSYLKLEDYNCDNIPDLIHRSIPGFSVYRGYYNAQNELAFTFYRDLYYSSQFGSVNAYCEPSDIPGVADIDGDGDLDFLAYSILGAQISFYRNCAVEDGLPCDSIRICLKDECWGKAYQTFNRTQQLHYSCLNSGTSCRPSGDSAGKTTLHTGNTICMIDIDADGDYDYLDGNISFSDIQLMINGKTQYGTGLDSMMGQDTLWQMNGHKAKMSDWPAAFWMDVDQDGKKDVLISPHADNTENYKSIAFYKNTGTTAAPVYTWQTDTFLIDKMIDAGTAATPFLYDYNKDGKPDLFVGSDGYYQGSGIMQSRISYYMNTSTSGNPSFTLQTSDFLGLSAQNFKGAALAVGDVDNDGKEDLVIGHANGMLSFYKNTAASASVQPVWQLNQLVMKDGNNDTIDVGEYATPCIYDMNKDGKPDLVIGYKVGWLYYYQNASTASGVLKMQLNTNQLGNVKSDPANMYSGYSVPYIGKMDNSGKDYILMGSNSGMLYRFDGFQNGNTQQVFPRIDTMYSGIKVGIRSAPAVADIDGDGKYDMIVGNQLGGVNLYKQVLTVSVSNVAGNQGTDCMIFPNPASDVLNVSWNNNFSAAETVHVTLYSMTGQRVAQAQANGSEHTLQMHLPELAKGMYFCVVRSADKQYISNVTILK